MRASLVILLAACAEPVTEEQATHPHRNDLGDSGSAAFDTGEVAEGESEQESGDQSRVMATDFPTQISCGEESQAVVVMKNTGDTVWTREDSYKLGAVGDDDPLFDSGDVRVWLQEEDEVFPGESYAFEIDLLGPDLDGLALTDWQMVREGVHWFGEITAMEVDVACDEAPEDPGDDEEETEALPLPDMYHVVLELADEYPEMLADSCLDDGGSWDFLDTLVDRLRETDERWGYNWKRGVEGDPSEDVVDYHYGSGEREGSEEVYIIDVIVGHCGPGPEPGWLDQTQATADAGTIGRWTSRGRF